MPLKRLLRNGKAKQKPASPTQMAVAAAQHGLRLKAGLVQLVETINAGHADIIVAEITLRLAQSRTAAQSPYEIVLCSSTEGNLLRTCLSKITQPGAPPQNTKEQVEKKSWELRAYRPNRKGALLRALHGGTAGSRQCLPAFLHG